MYINHFCVAKLCTEHKKTKKKVLTQYGTMFFVFGSKYHYLCCISVFSIKIPQGVLGCHTFYGLLPFCTLISSCHLKKALIKYLVLVIQIKKYGLPFITILYNTQCLSPFMSSYIITVEIWYRQKVIILLVLVQIFLVFGDFLFVSFRF